MWEQSVFDKLIIFLLTPLILAAAPVAVNDRRAAELRNKEAVLSFLKVKPSAEEAKRMQAVVKEARDAAKAKRYGPAVKAWSLAALIQPNAANLAALAETSLQSVGMAGDAAYAAQSRKAILPDVLKLYEVALVSEEAMPVLGAAKAQVVADHSCLKTYLEKNAADRSCRPLQWSGAIGIKI
jgi:hypothetical protein